MSQVDASAVVPTATPAPTSPAKAEPVAVGHAVAIVPTPDPSIVTNPAPAPAVTAVPTAATPVVTTPSTTKAEPVSGFGAN